MNIENLLNKSDEFLAEAYSELFENWGIDRLVEDKADEIRSIIKGRCKPSVSFVNWVKFIDFLKNN
jgi:hypothetical protein